MLHTLSDAQIGMVWIVGLVMAACGFLAACLVIGSVFDDDEDDERDRLDAVMGRAK